MPSFNFEGRKRVSSYVGFSFSVILYLCMVGYGASRFVILIGDGNPILSTYQVKNEYDLRKRIDLDEYGF